MAGGVDVKNAEPSTVGAFQMETYRPFYFGKLCWEAQMSCGGLGIRGMAAAIDLLLGSPLALAEGPRGRNIRGGA
jgi:hypothetical protein